jgi:hypothetical protein
MNLNMNLNMTGRERGRESCRQCELAGVLFWQTAGCV